MAPHQAAFDQKLQRAVHGGGAYPVALLLQDSADTLAGEMFFREENDLSDKTSLAGDRLVMLPEITAKALGVCSGLRLIQSGHQA
jgi:hypothetical protein